MAIINACFIARDLKDTYAMHKHTEAGGACHFNVCHILMYGGGYFWLGRSLYES